MMQSDNGTPSSDAPATGADRNHLKLVLVSQPGTMQNVLFSMLRSLPTGTVGATNGALTAFDLLENEPVDVVIVDANLPLSERLALVGRIRRQFPRVLSVVLTMTDRHRALLRTAGADLIMPRDVSLQELETALLSGCQRVGSGVTEGPGVAGKPSELQAHPPDF